MATSKIKSNTWIKLGDYSATAAANISSITFSEIMVIGRGMGGNIPIIVPKSDLSGTARTYFAGGYALSTAYVGFYATISVSQITTGMYINGELRTNDNYAVYYK